MNMIIPPTGKRSLREILDAKKAAELARIQEQQETAIEIEATTIAPALESGTLVASPSEIINPTTPKNPSLLEILKAKRLAADAEKQAKIAVAPVILPPLVETLIEQGNDKEEKPAYDGAFSLNISLNAAQEMAKDMAFAGKSFCLVGAAGTGKTTAQREIAKSLLESGALETHDFRIQGSGMRETCPSIAFVAYTRIASNNLRRAIHKDPDMEKALPHNVTTIHNLLEYRPETYWDAAEGKERFRFTPNRTAANPLDITHLVIEESSMVGLDLWEKLYNALRDDVQIIFIGDINQLPPVFGDSILNYALVQLPVVELTEVYRQAENSGILENAHNVLAGRPIEPRSDVKLIPCGTTNYTQEKLSIALGQMFPKWEEAGEYDPMQDIILCPWNKRALGTDNMNKWIAQYLGQKRDSIVHEVIFGMGKTYLAVGDKVMYNKQVGVIEKITYNGRYMGRAPLPASTNLTRFGNYTGAAADKFMDVDSIDYSNIDLDAMMTDTEDRTREASHIVDILLDEGETATLSAVGDFSPSTFSLAYCLTVHKAQGCEWRKVYMILHRDHKVSLCREMLYTAITRAREQLAIIAKPDVIEAAIRIQRIKGNTITEKVEYFNSGISLNNAVHCTK